MKHLLLNLLHCLENGNISSSHVLAYQILMSNSCHEILREGIMVFSSLTKSYVRALWCFHLSLNDWCQGIYRSFTKKNLHLRKNELHDQQKELSAQGSIICQNYTRDLSPPFTCSSHLCHGHLYFSHFLLTQNMGHKEVT